MNNPKRPLSKSWFTKEWWAQVTLAPEDSKTTVFNNGIEKGSITISLKPYGGQIYPNSAWGPQQLWK